MDSISRMEGVGQYAVVNLVRICSVTSDKLLRNSVGHYSIYPRVTTKRHFSLPNDAQVTG